ncbi:relaxase/mobilization nuclease domain-containing protein [Streptomyces roseolus]|uniref:relaxase/mobilization nuclease domain-containing protein n=1 Tax=Streptomyces roseolus TaxID=67358 RepID=UPI0036506FDF
MVPDIGRGSRTHGLLVYLYGPGRREEHTDAHLVGSWDGFAPDPGRDASPDPDPQVTLARLAAALDLRVKQAGDRAPAKHVWHCSVRTAPGDRRLSDEEWNAVAQRIVHATGIAPDGDPDGCRWIVVRHADDHIHIVATLVRGDLRNPRLNYDFNKAQAVCRRIEKEMGLRRLNAGDGTAAKNPTSAEKFKAERTGRPETSRETLRDAVRQALAGAADEKEFFTRLREAGLRVKVRHAPSGDALGYNVALPGDRNRHGEPVWYPGSKLAPDLSLPKVRLRLADGTVEQEAALSAVEGRPEWSPPARARRSATDTAERAAVLLDSDGDDEEAAAQLAGVGELLDALAQTSPAATRAELAAAARAFERATRSYVRAEHADTRALRSAARGIVQAGGALGRGEDGGTTAMLVSTLVLVALAAARWHSARGHAQQAHAARQAAEHLRTAYHQAAATPMRVLHDQGRALPEAQRRAHEATLRAVLPEQGVQADGVSAKTDALVATLAQAEQAGHNPEALLKQAIDLRELDTAENVNDVLLWRLRRIAQLPAQPSEALRRPQAGTRPTKTSANYTSERNAPTAAPRTAVTDPRSRPPRH